MSRLRNTDARIDPLKKVARRKRRFVCEHDRDCLFLKRHSHATIVIAVALRQRVNLIGRLKITRTFRRSGLSRLSINFRATNKIDKLRIADARKIPSRCHCTDDDLRSRRSHPPPPPPDPRYYVEQISIRFASRLKIAMKSRFFFSEDFSRTT